MMLLPCKLHTEWSKKSYHSKFMISQRIPTKRLRILFFRKFISLVKLLQLVLILRRHRVLITKYEFFIVV